MAVIEVKNLTKRYGELFALSHVNLRFQDGQFFGLLGPSGSGKTTLLRAIAGFVEADQGEIYFDDQRVEHIPTHQRHIGMVFQNYALFPHMSVAENIAFGLTVQSRKHTQNIQKQVEEALELVRLPGLGERKPHELSGGQQQRVALARALITKPKVLLLDEPLGALDRRLRQDMQVELKRIQRQSGVTTIFVTHDQEEALSLSDHIAIIDKGEVIQHGSPAEIYERPANIFAAQFLGDANIFADGKSLIRPEKISLDNASQIHARVEQVIFSGPSVTYHLSSTAFQNEKAMCFVQNLTSQPHKIGDIVKLSWNEAHVVKVPS